MRAVVYDQVGGPITVREVPDPECARSGAVIAVRASGVCRSDWHAWRGQDRVALPHIPGHEFAGVVTRVGPAVRRWRPGDRVTVPFACGCGRCEYCHSGDPQVCPNQRQPGFSEPGSLAEFVAVPAVDANLVAVPEEIEFTTAASFGCRFATAFRALNVHARVRPGQWVVVYGCGGLGLAAVMIAIAMGGRVIAVDPAGAARARAAALGAAHVLDPDTADPVAAVLDITGGGAHVGVDAAGGGRATGWSVRSLRRRGRHIQVALLFGPDSLPPISMDLVIANELEVYGSHGIAAHEYPAMISMVVSGELHPDRLISAVVGLEGAAQALAAMDRPAERGGITIAVP